MSTVPAVTSISFDDLESAFFWVGGAPPGVNSAFICRRTGRTYYASEMYDSDDELPDDIDDASLYLAVPDKNELGLGRELALRFVDETLPDEYHRVRSFFGRRGAYARFKDFLEVRGRLEAWFDYERRATAAALRAWAAENGLAIISPAPRSGG